MNIIEAIKSGKRFRRGTYAWLSETENSAILFPLADILADDWEIEEEKIEITLAQFFEAAHRAHMGSSHRSAMADETIMAYQCLLAEHLGFKS